MFIRIGTNACMLHALWIWSDEKLSAWRRLCECRMYFFYSHNCLCLHSYLDDMCITRGEMNVPRLSILFVSFFSSFGKTRFAFLRRFFFFDFTHDITCRSALFKWTDMPCSGFDVQNAKHTKNLIESNRSIWSNICIVLHCENHSVPNANWSNVN